MTKAMKRQFWCAKWIAKKKLIQTHIQRLPTNLLYENAKFILRNLYLFEFSSCFCCFCLLLLLFACCEFSIEYYASSKFAEWTLECWMVCLCVCVFLFLFTAFEQNFFPLLIINNFLAASCSSLLLGSSCSDFFSLRGWHFLLLWC